MSKSNGVVYTKGWVVELILNLIGYTSDKPLWKQTIVEPSCGAGSFLMEIVKRLLCSVSSLKDIPVISLRNCIVSYDIDPDSVQKCRNQIVDLLTSYEIDQSEAKLLSECWVRCCDYLCTMDYGCDYVVGNPPYIRAAEIPSDDRKKYSKRLSSMTQGCDLYVGFIQRGLDSLNPNGKLCFICSDRWLQNQYGKKLRGYISSYWHYDLIIRMHGVNAFESFVSAYPAIIKISHDKGPVKYINCEAAFSANDSSRLQQWVQSSGEETTIPNATAMLMNHPMGDGVISLSAPEKVEAVSRMMEQLPSLEESGVRVGIGIATGKDDVFIVDNPDLVEPDRLLPVFNMRDWRKTGEPSQKWLVNPWDENGKLVNLANYPRLRDYLELHREEIASRHIAKKNAQTWYRTIDKVNHEIIGRPMLLFPDMAKKADPVFSDGSRYPCHNCYWLMSDKWDLKVLGGLLMSDIAESFVDSMGVKMRGGTKRFQAQYLRLIHVPKPEMINAETALDLRTAFDARDRLMANKAALKAYGLEGKR